MESGLASLETSALERHLLSLSLSEFKQRLGERKEMIVSGQRLGDGWTEL